MAKTKKEKMMLIKRGIMAALTILIIVYVFYVVGRASFTQIKSVGAAETKVYDSINVNGYIVRSEQYVEYKGNGVISYTVSDGDKISKDEAVANIFSDADLSSKKQELDKLEKELAALNQLEKSTGTFSQTPDEIDKAINGLLCQSNINLVNRDISLADKNIQDVLYYINERQLVTGKVTSYGEKIKEIEGKINSLKKSDASIQKTNQVKAPSSGYFVSRTDGYENSFDTKKLNELMPGSLSKSKIKQNDVSKNVIGKIVNKVYWYIVCEVTSQDAIRIKNASYLKVNIPVVSNQNIKVELESLNQKDKASDAVVILKGTYMNEQMANIRNENISIIIDDYTGIYVPKSAVHEKKLKCTIKDENGKEKTIEQNVPGVYVKVGTEISFKQILPIYSGEDYVISSTNEKQKLPSDDTGRLQIYDQIVTEGANLYDGKIV